VAVTVATVTGTSALAPAASAKTPEPTPSTSVTPLSAAGNGSVTILKKDPDGDVLAGATFTLLDSTGKQAASGTTNAEGQLAFQGLAPGVYRLKEVASGSPLYEVVDDQDVIVTPGADTPLTITDPFQAAKVLLQAKDDKTGKLLSGATVNIGTGDSTLLTMTTGAKGTASGELPVSSRKTQFWVKEIKAPAGYKLYSPSKSFTAGPGTPVTVTVTNSKTTTGSSPAPTQKPTSPPTSTAPTTGDSTAPSESPTGHTAMDAGSSLAADASREATPKTQTGSLAHTGADATPWLLGGAGLLVAGGIAIVVAARTRRSDSDENSPFSNG
jgi:hypothetical protein